MKIVRKEWRENGVFPNMLFTWLKKPIPTDDGNVITNMCSTELTKVPVDADALAVIERVNPYAFLLVLNGTKGIYLCLESAHGSNTMILPFELKGVDPVLGKEKPSQAPTGLGKLRGFFNTK